jgi:hypothetical protein
MFGIEAILASFEESYLDTDLVPKIRKLKLDVHNGVFSMMYSLLYLIILITTVMLLKKNVELLENANALHTPIHSFMYVHTT